MSLVETDSVLLRFLAFHTQETRKVKNQIEPKSFTRLCARNNALHSPLCKRLASINHARIVEEPTTVAVDSNNRTCLASVDSRQTPVHHSTLLNCRRHFYLCNIMMIEGLVYK